MSKFLIIIVTLFLPIQLFAADLDCSKLDKLSKDYLRYLSNFIRKRVDLLGLTIIFDLKNQEK